MDPNKTDTAASAAGSDAADIMPVNNVQRFEGGDAGQIDLQVRKVHPTLISFGIAIDPDCPPPLVWEDGAEVYLLHLCTHKGKQNHYYVIKYSERNDEKPTRYYPTGEWALVVLATRNSDGSTRIEARITTNQEGRGIHLKTSGGAKNVLQSCIIKFKDGGPGELEKWCNRSGGYHTPDNCKDQAYLSVKACRSSAELASLPTEGFYQTFTFSLPDPKGDTIETSSAGTPSTGSREIRSQKTPLGSSAPTAVTSSELDLLIERADSKTDRLPTRSNTAGNDDFDLFDDVPEDDAPKAEESEVPSGPGL